MYKPFLLHLFFLSSVVCESLQAKDSTFTRSIWGNMSEASKTPLVHKDEEKTSAGTPSEQGRATPPVAAIPNPFDLSAMIGSLNQPGIKELAELVARDPSFNKMAEQLQEAMQGVSVEEEFMAVAETLGNALMEDPSMSGILENLINPPNKDQLEEQRRHIMEDPSLKPIWEEIMNGGPAALMRCWNDEVVLQKMGEAMGFGVGADRAASAGKDEAEEANDKESIVHHTASVGDVE